MQRICVTPAFVYNSRTSPLISSRSPVSMALMILLSSGGSTLVNTPCKRSLAAASFAESDSSRPIVSISSRNSLQEKRFVSRYAFSSYPPGNAATENASAVPCIRTLSPTAARVSPVQITYAFCPSQRSPFSSSKSQRSVRLWFPPEVVPISFTIPSPKTAFPANPSVSPCTAMRPARRNPASRSSRNPAYQKFLSTITKHEIAATAKRKEARHIIADMPSLI